MTAPASGVLQCTKCNKDLPGDFPTDGHVGSCPSCRAELEITVFPAFHRPDPEVRRGELVIDDQEAGCFYHPQKKALSVCEACGRFLCALCEVELGGRNLCPGCIESGARKGKIKDLQHHRILYDDIALSVALVPLLIWFITFLTAPAAIVLALYCWNKPRSLVRGRGSTVRFIMAIVIALIQIGFWTAGATLLLSGWEGE